MSLLDIVPKKVELPSRNILDSFNDFIGVKVNELLAEKRPFEFKPKVSPEAEKKVEKALGAAKTLAQSILEFPQRPVTEFLVREKVAPPIATATGFLVSLLTPLPIGKSKTIKESPSALKALISFIKPVETRVAQETKFGKELARIITKATDVGEVEAGKRIDDLVHSGIKKLDRKNRFNLLDTLEGRAEAQSGKVANTAKAMRTQLDEIAKEAKEAGVLVKERVTLKPGEVKPKGITPLQFVKLSTGQKVPAVIKKPFEARKDFFPHIIPTVKELSSGRVRVDVIENIVRQGKKQNVQEARRFVDDFIDFLESGKRQDSLIKYMVDTGQAANGAEAFTNLQRFRSRTIKRQGSLEFARQADLPFYDPDPARVLPRYFEATSKRLAQIKDFGQNNEVINGLIKKIRDAGGDADTVRTAVDRILYISNAQTTSAKISMILRTIQGFKLGLAAIPNITQGVLNTLLAGDLHAVAVGIAGALNQQGRRFALRSGATLESTIRETLRQVGGEGSILGTFLKATGFSATEKLNRIIAANGGRSYGTRMLARLTRNPNDKRALEIFSEFGINVKAAVERGKLSDDEVLLFAKKFVDITQFRSRPQDLPLFASTPEGKVIFQFKNFIYGQTRLLNRVIVQEFRKGNYGRGVRNLIILSSIFPLTGEAIADIRSLVTGRERKETGLARYFDDIAQVGSLGILMETLRAGQFGKGTEFIVGPTIGDIGELINIAGKKDRLENLGKFLFRRIPVAGQVLKERVLKPKKKEEVKSNRFSL